MTPERGAAAQGRARQGRRGPGRAARSRPAPRRERARAASCSAGSRRSVARWGPPLRRRRGGPRLRRPPASRWPGSPGSSRSRRRRSGDHFGPAVTGVLQATLGNLPEFFVVVFALSAGEVVVAQFSIIGSIFANALLVLGFVIVVGAPRAEDGVMRFGAATAERHGDAAPARGFIIVIVGIRRTRTTARATTRRDLDHRAIALLIVYGVWVVPLPAQHARESAPGTPRDARCRSTARSGCSRRRASAPRSCRTGSSPRCARRSTSSASRRSSPGLVVVAIAGNAVEHVVGVVLAWKGQADLAISVVKNSVAQVAAFLPRRSCSSRCSSRSGSRSTSPRSTSPRSCSPRSRSGRSRATARRRVRGRGADRDLPHPRRVHALRVTPACRCSPGGRRRGRGQGVAAVGRVRHAHRCAERAGDPGGPAQGAHRAGRRRPGDRAPAPSATSSAPARARSCRRSSRAGSSGCCASGSDVP